MTSLRSHPAPCLGDSELQHGVLLEVHECGVLLTGAAGAGKSELALELITRGHRLIADDVVQLRPMGQMILGSCPPALRGFLAVRGLGLLNVQRLFGPQAVRTEFELSMIVNLSHDAPVSEDPSTVLNGRRSVTRVHGLEVEMLTLCTAQARQYPALLEAAALAFRLKQGGYDAQQDIAVRTSPQSLSAAEDTRCV